MLNVADDSNSTQRTDGHPIGSAPSRDFVYDSAVWEMRSFWPEGLSRPRPSCRESNPPCGMHSASNGLKPFAFDGWDKNWIAEEYATVYVEKVRVTMGNAAPLIIPLKKSDAGR